jgi:hypothetical protein
MYLLQTHTVFSSHPPLAGENLCEKAVIPFENKIPEELEGKKYRDFLQTGKIQD